MTLQEMLKLKKDYGFTNKQIADGSGVPLGTVQKVFGRSTGTPRYETLQALSVFFEREWKIRWGHGNPVWNDILEDSAMNTYGSRGQKGQPGQLSQLSQLSQLDQLDALHFSGRSGMTIKDYYELPDGVRVELIDGTFYDMASPTSVHQRIAGRIYSVLDQYVEDHNGPCTPFDAPMDVQLDADDKTMVQPDIMVVCDQSKITMKCIVGAPDFIVEVLSPGNWYMDLFRKMRKYRAAGVREYWVVIPEEKLVQVYYFESGEEMKEYTFEDKIPVGIWDGKCKVDFANIYRSLIRTMPFLEQ